MSILATTNVYSTVADKVETKIGWKGVVLGSNVFRFQGAGAGSAGWGAGWEASSAYLSAISTCPIGVVLHSWVIFLFFYLLFLYFYFTLLTPALLRGPSDLPAHS